MHIPDGYVDLSLALLFGALSVAVLGYAAERIDGEISDARAPLVGVVAAGVFAAQMLNWPIPGGTSAHFVGGAFAAILLGPHLGALCIATVVTIQALVFGDGGLVVLGANVFNMAIVEVYVGYAVYRAVAPYGEFRAAFAAGWLGITAGALSAGLQLGLSSAFEYQLLTTLAIMGVGHLVLGLVEGAITAAVYRYLVDARPDLRPTAAGEASV
ncbi:energy-coupling factor ABC transporter permease [Haloarcula nitratireducens]|uniref:Energy-coupling factor ABC transporter permease n=1 Tax=Haloarcula nitratireducens TaxID=2487749 RepID=A0AAW4PCS4_9EURY|nr:energy-coupling factor ABC transporter permease [Halomicroarcula nitratireducens]MBX0295235.1 energy-coupling factor ABC transporter permease [Halomicroarcula nitratireducens]